MDFAVVFMRSLIKITILLSLLFAFHDRTVMVPMLIAIGLMAVIHIALGADVNKGSKTKR